MQGKARGEEVYRAGTPSPKRIRHVDPELCALCATFYGPPELLGGVRNPAAIEWHRTKFERARRAVLAEEGVRFSAAMDVASRLVQGDRATIEGLELGLLLHESGIASNVRNCGEGGAR